MHVISAYTYVCTYMQIFSFPFCSTATESLRHDVVKVICSVPTIIDSTVAPVISSQSPDCITYIHLEMVNFIIKHLILIKYFILYNYIKVAK